MYVCLYVCIHVCMNVCRYVCMYVYVHVCMYICTYVCIMYVCTFEKNISVMLGCTAMPKMPIVALRRMAEPRPKARTGSVDIGVVVCTSEPPLLLILLLLLIVGAIFVVVEVSDFLRRSIEDFLSDPDPDPEFDPESVVKLDFCIGTFNVIKRSVSTSISRTTQRSTITSSGVESTFL